MAIRPRGKGKWQIEVNVGKKEDGSIKKIYKTIEGGKKEAKEIEAEMIKLAKTGMAITQNDLTFSQFIDKWFEEISYIKHQPKTIEGYEQQAKVVKEELGHFKLSVIKPYLLSNFYNKLREKNKPKKLSENTILHYYKFINVVLEQAVKWEFIPYNPNTKVDKPLVIKKEASFYIDEDITKLIACLYDEPLKYQALILLALDTGCRSGELTGLDWDDVDLEKNKIYIKQTTQYVNKTIITKYPKNHFSIRTVGTTEETNRILTEYKKEQELLAKQLGDKWMNCKKVFTSNNGGLMFPSTPSKIFKKIIKKHNLPNINFHGLRHTSLSYLINKGIPVIKVSKKAGHNNMSTTMSVYTHLLQQSDEAIDKAMNELIKIPTPLKNE